MPWTCPNCGRPFASANQSHSCSTHEVEDHFRNRSEAIVMLYRGLESMIEGLGTVEVRPMKTNILFRADVAFAVAKLRRNDIRLGFRFNRPLDSERLDQTAQISTNLVEHSLFLRSLDDLDDELEEWLRESWLGAGGQMGGGA